MKLSVPANWDIGLLDELHAFPVIEVYGMLNSSLVGGGRPSIVLPSVSRRCFTSYVKRVHSLNMEFNYILNAPCLNNLEYTYKFKHALIKYLSWMVEVGVDSITVSIPYLVELVKRRFPGLKIKISAIAQVDSLRKVKAFENLGADEIMLVSSLNRDFSLLETMQKSTKCKLRLILNDLCLYQCPFMFYHYNVSGHASQNCSPLKGFYIDYCFLKCHKIKLGSPDEFLKSRWIRPEDLSVYEKLGIDCFKISGREKHSAWILNAVQAYSRRSYDGNLIDLINCLESYDVSKQKILGSRHILDKFKSTIQYLSTNKLKTFLQFAAKLPIGMYRDLFKLCFTGLKFSENIYIDNNKLQGFISYFSDGNCKGDCSACSYCSVWAEKCLSFNKVQLNNYYELLQNLTEKAI